MELRTLMVIALLVGAASAGPISWDDSKCSVQCTKPQQPKFQYEIGKTYIYSLQSSSEVQLTDSSGDKVVVQMAASVEIGVLSDCEMIMQLRDVSLTNSDSSNSDAFKSALEKRPLPFAIQDGKLQHVCASSDDQDDVYVLNIKRAILSLLQHSASNLINKETVKETDISGICETEYVQSKGWGSLTVVKTKDLKSCSDRLTSPISSFSTRFSTDSSVKTLPVIKSEQRCEQIISDKLIKNVKCHEENIFSPLSEKSQGVGVRTDVSLAYSKTQDGVKIRSQGGNDPKSLLFAPSGQESEESTEREARAVLADLCQSTREGITIKTPFKIGKLISVVRGLSMERISQIYVSLENDKICPSDIVQDIFIDALSMAGTKGAIRWMSKLVQDDKLSDIRVQAWLTMLAFNQKGDSESIRALVPFLRDYEKGGRQGILGVSSYIYNFCNQDPEQQDCLLEIGVKEAIAALKEQLGSDCASSSDEEEDRIVLALAGFENIGRVGDAREKIKACFTKSSNSPVVRHAAIKAFRRVPCKPEATRKMMALYKDQSEDAEIRIYAYLGAMRCASSQVVHEVKAVLDKESVNQVGAFVWSHLTNLQETSAPLKQDIRAIVSDITLKKKFSTDLRKYSQFVEWSAFSERLNVGADAEMTVVRSPKSFLPRYVSLNVSTQLFEESLPILEVGAHMQGLEHIFEKYFGDEGIIKNMEVEDIMKLFGFGNDDDDEDEDDNDIDSNNRNVRSVSKYNRLSLLKERVNMRSEKEPKASVYMSLFGRKIARFTSQDLKDMLTLKEAFNVMEILTQLAEQRKVERSMTVQFLDAEISLPSISGMKISLGVNGTVTAAVKIDGKFDIRKLFTSEHSADIDGILSPSAAVEVAAIMAIDSGVSRPGLKSVFIAHSSQTIQGSLKIKNNRVVDLKVNMPRDKIEVLTVSAKMYSVEKNGEEKQIVSKKNYDMAGCTSALHKPLGIKFCTKLHAPKPLLSLDSPFLMVATDASLEITLEKSDKAMRGYELHIELPSKHDYEVMRYKFELDTPGSKINRHFALEATVKSKGQEHTANFELTSPIKKLVGSGSIVNQPELKRYRGAVKIDDSKDYSFDSEIKIKRQGEQVEFQPSVTVSWPRAQPFTMGGSVSYNLGRKQMISVDLKANRPTDKPVFVKGTITKDGEFSARHLQGKLRISSDISFSTPLLESRLHGTVDKQESVMASDISIDYKLKGGNRHTTKMVTKIQNHSTRYLSKLNYLEEFTSTQFPEHNMRVSWGYQHKSMEYLENEVTVHLGEDLDSEENKYHLLQVSKLEGVSHHGLRGKSDHHIKFNAPCLENELDLTSEAEWDFVEKPNLDVKVDLKHSDDKHMKASALYSYKSTKPIEMHIEAKFVTPEHEMIYQDTLRERSPNEFEGKTMVQWQRGQRATVDYIYRMKSDSEKTHHEVELKMSSPSMTIPMQHRGLLRVTRDTVHVNSHTQYEGRPVYSIEAKLARDEDSKIDLTLKDWECVLELKNKPEQRLARLDIQNEKEDVHLLGSASYVSDERRVKRTLTIQGSFNPERDLSNNFQFSTSVIRKSERKPIQYGIESSWKVGKYYATKVQASITKDVLHGPNDITLELKSKHIKPVLINVQHELQNGNMRCEFRYSYDKQDQLQVLSNSKYEETSSTTEASVSVAVKSKIRSLNGKEFHVTLKSDESSKYTANIRVQEAPGKPYNLNLEHSYEETRSAHKLRYHAMLNTPIPEYRSQEATVVAEFGRSTVFINVDANSAQGKRLHGTFKSKLENDKVTGSLDLNLPFKSLRSLRLNSVADYNEPISIETEVHANGEKKAEWSLKLHRRDKQSFQFRAKSAFGPKYEVRIDGFDEKKKITFESSLRRNDAELYSTNILYQKQGKNYNGHIQLKRGDWIGIVEMKNENISPVNRVYQLSTRGISEPISVVLKIQGDSKMYSPELTICAESRAFECFVVKGSYSNKDKQRSHEIHRELEVKITQGSDLDLSLVLEHNADKDSFSQKAELDAFSQELGYEIELKDREGTITGLARVKMPSRQILAQAEYEDNDDKMELSAKLFTDEIRQPLDKLELDISHENSVKEGLDVSHSSLEIKHPVFESPIKVDLLVQSSDDEVIRPLSAKMEVDISSDSRKKIIVVAYLEKPYKDDSNITSFFNIYHPDRTDLDIMVKGHIGDREERFTSGLNWHIVNNGNKREGHSLLEIDYSEKEIHFHSRCPLHQFESHGKWEYSKSELFTLNIDSKLDDDESAAKFVLDISKPCAELTLYAEPGSVSSRYHSCIDTQGKSLMTITAESYEGSEKQTDVSFVFDRRHGKVFNAHVHWRPEKLEDIMGRLVELSESADFEIDTDKYLNYLSSKLEIVTSDFNKLVAKPFSQFIWSEVKAIAQELSRDFREVGVALEKLPSLSDLIDWYVPESVQRVVREIYEYIEEKLDDITPLSCEYGTICYKISYAYNRHGLEGLIEYVYSAFVNMPAGYYKLMITFKDLAVSYLYIPSVWEPIMETFESVGEYIQELVDPITNSESYSKIKEQLSDWQESVGEVISEVADKYLTYIDSAIDYLLETPEMKAIVDTLESILEEIEKELNNLHLDQIAQRIVDFSKDFFSAKSLKDSVRFITLDPENGQIQVEIRLPAEVNTLKSNLKKVYEPFNVEDITFLSTIKKSSKKVNDIHRATKQEWVPPFHVLGQVVSGMHYKTFDNKFYEFAGKCSYLLAHDFEDGNFSIIMKYKGHDNKGGVDKSIVVIIDEKVIEINTDQEIVKVDEQDTELPIVLKRVTIVRRGDTIIIDSRRGLSVTCNIVHDFCSTSMSGWYYGKTAGLFGTYDNEQSNDLMKPKGQIAHDVEAFARSWEVSNGCKYQNLARDVDIDIKSPQFDVCRDHFENDDSPLSDCFDEVDSKEYLRMCRRQVAIQRNPAEAACAIAAAYADICERRQVSVSMPTTCMKCQSIAGVDIAHGEQKIQKENIPQSADVVFILEERTCNRDIVKDNMESIARLIDRELINSGYSSNRFGVVAFGGKQQEQEAHSHTSRGKLFFEIKDVVLAIEKLEYKEKKDKSDAFSAVKFAINYPFRAGVSKSIILLTCSQCDEDHMKVDYSDIQNMLLEHGIILHTLTNRDIQIRGSASKSKGIYGIDSNTVFRSKDISQKELEGTPDLRAQVAVPKDVCVALAQEAHGSFFTTKPLIEGQSSESKNWKSLVARRVALSAEPHECQKCSCDSTKDNVPKTVCKPCKPLSPKVSIHSYYEEE